MQLCRETTINNIYEDNLNKKLLIINNKKLIIINNITKCQLE